jgi:excisionase family DNA binding protein
MATDDNMSDLLTTKQVQTLLQVDRTTIYRMLRDGRLSGVKVGHQWRFSNQHIDSLLHGHTLPQHEETFAEPQESLPIDCFQLMQDIFTDITEIGAVTIKADGTPLTQTSLNCQFCQMILSSETGNQACQASQKKLIANPEEQNFAVCHAGLHYLQAPIKINDTVTAVLIAGQFYNQSPDQVEEVARVRELAQKHGLDEAALANAARDILVLNGRNKTKIGDWLNKIAATFEHISCERASFMTRLQKIAAMSDLTHD